MEIQQARHKSTLLAHTCTLPESDCAMPRQYAQLRVGSTTLAFRMASLFLATRPGLVHAFAHRAHHTRAKLVTQGFIFHQQHNNIAYQQN